MVGKAKPKTTKPNQRQPSQPKTTQPGQDSPNMKLNIHCGVKDCSHIMTVNSKLNKSWISLSELSTLNDRTTETTVRFMMRKHYDTEHNEVAYPKEIEKTVRKKTTQEEESESEVRKKTTQEESEECFSTSVEDVEDEVLPGLPKIPVEDEVLPGLPKILPIAFPAPDSRFAGMQSGNNRFPACTKLREIINMKIITVLRRERLARDTAAAEASLAALDLVENNIDSDDDDWSAYFSSLGMPDIPDIPDIPDMDDLMEEPTLVVPTLVVPTVPTLQNRHRRRGRVPIDPLTSTEEAILAGLIAASPENKVKIRQRYMSRRRVRARLGI